MLGKIQFSITVNVEIYALYIFLHNLQVLKIQENIYIMKISFTIQLRGNIMKNTNINPRENVNFLKYMNIYTHEKYMFIVFRGHYLALLAFVEALPADSVSTSPLVAAG